MLSLKLSGSFWNISGHFFFWSNCVCKVCSGLFLVLRPSSSLRHHSFKRKGVELRSVVVFSEGAGSNFWKCLLCVCLPGPGCRHYTSSGQAAVFGLPMHRFRLWCGVPPSCVCQRQFGLIYRPSTHSALDPTSALGMAIPCVGGESTWVVLH